MNIYPFGDTVREDKATGDEADLGGGMDLEWLGLAWSVTGIHGACRRPGAYSALGV